MSRKRRSLGSDMAIVAQGVADLKNEFQYPDVAGRGISNPRPQAGGGGGAPTIVVAASDASDIAQAKADFVCDGTNDHEEIQAALDLMDTGTGLGGRCLLTEGTFNCAFGVIFLSALTAAAPVHLQGMGQSTLLSFSGGSGSAIEVNGDNCKLSDLWVQGNFTSNRGGIDVDGEDCILDNVRMNEMGSNPGAGCITVTALGDRARIVNCRVDDSDPTGIFILTGANEVVVANCHISATGVGVNTNGIDSVITGNHIASGDDAIRVSGGQHTVIAANSLSSDSGWGVNINNDSLDQVTITGNDFHRCDSGAVQCLGSPDISVVGNTIFESPFFGAGAAIDCSDPVGSGNGLGLNIADNIIDIANANGISVDQYGDVRVAGNILRNIDGHGIAINDVSDAKISGNVISNVSGDGTNTFDGIIVTGDSDMNYIHGNTVIPGSVVAPRYGINIADATCDCNIVVGNSLGPTGDYGTDALNDSGSATQLFYPADATYGDNFIGCWGS